MTADTEAKPAETSFWGAFSASAIGTEVAPKLVVKVPKPEDRKAEEPAAAEESKRKPKKIVPKGVKPEAGMSARFIKRNLI